MASWSTNSNTALNSAGYQIYSIGGAAQTGTTAGPAYARFYESTIVCGSAGTTPGKAIYLQQSYQWKFYNGACSGGDQPNAVRLSDNSSGYYANLTHFWDWSGTLPTPLGNRGAQFTTEASSTVSGGLTATQGNFFNVAGTVTGSNGTFSGTLGVTGQTTLTAVNRVTGSGGTLSGTAAWRLGDGNSGASRDWSVSNGAGGNATGQIGALIVSQSTAVNGDPMVGTERARVTASGLQVTNGFGCNGKTAQAAVASGGALATYSSGSFGLDSAAHMQSLYNLVVAMRAALVANGIMS